MKRFLLHFVLIICFVYLGNLFILDFAKREYYKNYQVVPSHGFHKFIFADSHGLPLDDELEDVGVYNYSSESESYIDIERKLNYLITNGFRIDTILLSVDDHCLSTYRENSNNLDRSDFYLGKDDFSNFFHYLKFQIIGSYFPIFKPKVRTIFRSYLLTSLSRLFTSMSLKDLNKSNWADLSMEEKQSKAEHRKKGQFPESEPSVLLVSSLEDLIQTCESRGIYLAGIKFPITKVYKDLIEHESYGADSIFRAHQIVVLDFQNLFDESQFYFANQDHLNKIGGKVFADILRREIKQEKASLSE